MAKRVGIETADRSFFVWKKILVRLVHLTITLFVTGSLFIKNTELHNELLSQNYIKSALFVAFTYASIMFYFLTCLIDPGYVTATDKEDGAGININKIDSNSDLKLRYCEVCDLEQPIRSRHCAECHRCIKKFDHHCPWLECCVGENNHKYFVLFLATTLVTIVWSFVIAWRAFEPSTNWIQWLAVNVIYIVDLHVLFISFLVCTGLLLTHTYFMITNTTTWEKFSRRNITYLRTIKDDNLNPFHESYLKNILQFCCHCKTVDWENIYIRFTTSTKNCTGSASVRHHSTREIHLEQSTSESSE